MIDNGDNVWIVTDPTVYCIMASFSFDYLCTYFSIGRGVKRFYNGNMGFGDTTFRKTAGQNEGNVKPRRKYNNSIVLSLKIITIIITMIMV